MQARKSKMSMLVRADENSVRQRNRTCLSAPRSRANVKQWWCAACSFWKASVQFVCRNDRQL